MVAIFRWFQMFDNGGFLKEVLKIVIVFTWGWPVGAETCCDTERYNNTNKIFSVAIAGICLKDSYVSETRLDCR
jgi:hypothetical protein